MWRDPSRGEIASSVGQFNWTSFIGIDPPPPLEPPHGMGLQVDRCLWCPIKVVMIPFSSTCLMFVPSATKILPSAPTVIPFGYDSRASLAFPPSPQLSDSPGRHLWPFPIKGSQLFSTSVIESKESMPLENGFLSKTFLMRMTRWDSGWDTKTVCFCSSSCLRVQWARWKR